jgi:hypothetical protein
VSGAVRQGEIGDDRHDGELQVPGVQGSEANAGVPAEQLEHRTPALPIEAAPYDTESLHGLIRAAQCPHGERDAGRPEVQGTVLHVVDRSDELVQALGGCPPVTGFDQSFGSFLQRQHHAGTAVVERRVTCGIGMFDQPVRRPPRKSLDLLGASVRN